MIIKINIFLCGQLISMFIMGYPVGKTNIAAVSAKRGMYRLHVFASNFDWFIRLSVSVAIDQSLVS